MPDLLFPKPRPAALERQDRKAVRVSLDEAESRKVKVRSGGHCEVWWESDSEPGERSHCRRWAKHVHHLLSGIGVRGRGDSALARNKLHVCGECHRLIHAHVLVHQGGARFQCLK